MAVAEAARSTAVDVRLEGVTKRFGDVVAVDDLSLSVPSGSFFALLGPSGCGKTTTLRMIGGFEEPTAGRVHLGERDVTGLPPYRRDVNTVFQSYALFPHLSVFENVAFGLRRKRVDHGITFGGHPVMSAIALKNIEIMKREQIVEGVREHEDAFRSTLAQLLDLPIAGDLRGAGFFYALELVKDKETRETFTDEECEWLLRGFLSQRLFERGLICRADDRGDPVIQISPPLVARQREFDEIAGILGDVLTEAWDRLPA
jgi:ABC-type sugar transport system ATPase subunit